MKTLSIIIIYILCFKSIILSQGAWTQKTDLGGVIRYDAVSFSIGTKGYIGTGWTVESGGYYLNDFWEWDQASGTWTQKADFGGINRDAAVGFSIGTKGYIGLGYFAPIQQKDFWEWDQVTNVWTPIADFAGVTRENSVGFSIGAKGYVGTGYNNGLLKDFWEYNPSTDRWTQKADFGGGERELAVGFSIGTKGYIGTGDSAGSDNITMGFWEYDPLIDTWTQKADFGGGPNGAAIGFSIDSMGYIGTGFSNPNIYRKDFWEYNPSTDTWIQKAAFGGTIRGFAVGLSIGTKGYIGTGYSNTTGSKNDFWEYDPSGVSGINEWQSNSHVTVYPNPFTDISTVKIETEAEPPFSFGIYNALGEKVQSLSNINNRIFALERNGMPAGIYIYYITDCHKNIIGTNKLIVIN